MCSPNPLGVAKFYALCECDNRCLLQVSVEKRLLDMCIQIAKGMEYLASKRIVQETWPPETACMLAEMS